MNAVSETYLRDIEKRVRSYYEDLAPDYARWVDRYGYYYQRKVRILRHLIPWPGRVLAVGCGIGQNLAGLEPDYGLGIDLSPRIIEAARKRYPEDKYPHLEFRCLSALDIDQVHDTFDTILLVNVASEIPELVEFFQKLRGLCRPETRIVQVCFNYLLAPVVRGAGSMGMAPKHPMQNWLTRHDLDNLLELTGFETVRDGFEMLLPFGVPGIANLVNRYGPLVPGLRYLCLLYYSVIRMGACPRDARELTVSVCVPCKNEEGNIDGLIERIPQMGAATEVIFVDDRSTDGTAAKVKGHMEDRTRPDLQLVEGPGVNKGAACRAGFERANNDVLMILDADMAVMPEDLPKFLEAIASGRGEFVNGSRLVYPIESGAMRFANIVGNKLFALAFSFLLGQRLKDTLCGTKVIWRKDYRRLLEARERFGAVDRWGDYDWIFGAARHNLKIIELPVHYRERQEGETKMTRRLKNAWVMLRMCGVALAKVKLVR